MIAIGEHRFVTKAIIAKRNIIAKIAIILPCFFLEFSIVLFVVLVICNLFSLNRRFYLLNKVVIHINN